MTYMLGMPINTNRIDPKPRQEADSATISLNIVIFLSIHAILHRNLHMLCRMTKTYLTTGEDFTHWNKTKRCGKECSNWSLLVRDRVIRCRTIMALGMGGFGLRVHVSLISNQEKALLTILPQEPECELCNILPCCQVNDSKKSQTPRLKCPNMM